MTRTSWFTVAICTVVLTGCYTTGQYFDDETVRGSFYSPFDSFGELTPWAEAAIEQGIGLRVHANRSPYPSNRRIGKRESLPTEGVRPRDARDANLTAQMLGGWQYIAETSEYRFGDVDQLALHMWENNANHDRYAEALAATMSLYPELEARYHLVIRNR